MLIINTSEFGQLFLTILSKAVIMQLDGITSPYLPWQTMIYRCILRINNGRPLFNMANHKRKDLTNKKQFLSDYFSFNKYPF